MNRPPGWQGVILFGVAVVPIGFTLAMVLRARISRLHGATVLVIWGLFIAAAEHAGFGRSAFLGSNLATHEGFHHQMLAAYGIAAFALTAIVIAPLVHRGDKLGWYGLLVLLVIGVGTEVFVATVTTPHGMSPRWWSWGLALWAYPIAWATALLLSWRPIFGLQPPTDGVGGDLVA